MDREFKKISSRHHDVMRGATNYQISPDLRALLGHIDQLHLRMVERTAESAVQAAFRALENGQSHAIH